MLINPKKQKEITVPRGTHPDYVPFTLMNQGDTVYFESYLDNDPLAPRFCYYYPEKPEHRVLKMPKGGRVTLPHSKYTQKPAHPSGVIRYTHMVKPY